MPTTHNIKHSSVLINKAIPRFVITNSHEPFLVNTKTIDYGINVYEDQALLRRINIIALKD
jgi:hypothetical protein